MKKAFATLLLAAAAGHAFADAPLNKVALEAESSRLGAGQPDWRQQTLRLGHQRDRRTLVEVEASHVHRYGQHDVEAALAGSLPLAEPLTLALRVSHSPTHRVIARGSAGAALQWEFQRAWLLHGALRHTKYDAVDVNLASLMLEHYFGEYSALLGVHNARAFGRDTRSYELRASRYYGEGSSVGFLLAVGDEAVAIAPGTVVLARVETLALLGRHAMTGPWALRWGLHRTRQGSFHTRTGGSLGVEYVF